MNAPKMRSRLLLTYACVQLLCLLNLSVLAQNAPSAGARGPTLGDMVSGLVAKLRSTPDCTYKYTAESPVPESIDHYRALMTKAKNEGDGVDISGLKTKLRRFEVEFYKYKDLFFFKTFDENGELFKHMAFDGSTYYYLDRSERGGRRLYLGSDFSFFQKMLSSSFLTSPLYAVYQPFMPHGDVSFCYPYINSSDFWFEALKGCSISNSVPGKSVSLSRDIGSIQMNIKYDLVTHTSELEATGQKAALGTKVKIEELCSVAPGVTLPLSYVIGVNPEKRVLGTTFYKLNKDSFRLTTAPPKEGFAIPRVSAEELFDTDLGVLIKK